MTDIYNNNCTDCDLCIKRKIIVRGNGNPNADIMIMGEAPAYHEDTKGQPFVGKAGKLLNHTLDKCGFTRDDVYTTNVVKCRPPKNRQPTMIELAACAKYLKQELINVKPKILLLLGATAAKTVFAKADIRISDIRGYAIDYKGYIVIPTYHPSAVLRDPTKVERFFNDFKLLVTKYRSNVDSLHITNY